MYIISFDLFLVLIYQCFIILEVSTQITNTISTNGINETDLSNVILDKERKPPEETITLPNIINSSEVTSIDKSTRSIELTTMVEVTTDNTNLLEKAVLPTTVESEQKQFVPVTPATDVTEQEPLSNVICEQCVCANNTVDCHNKGLTTSFEITDWEGLEASKPFTIDLSINPLTKFSRISNLPTVKFLNLSNCGLSDIEYASFSYLQELVTLDLSNNKLVASSINRRVFVGIIDPKADRILPFGNIQYLSLANNEIHSLTQDVFMFMNGLSSLDLSGNSLGHMDQVTMGAITDLINLKELNLSGCDLETLPEGLLRRLQNLNKLDLSNNKLTSVPAVLNEAVNLKYLDFGGNPLESLHKSSAISNLTKLRELRLCGLSKLTTIADGALGGLESLTSLHVCNNPRLSTLEDGFLVWKDKFDHEVWPNVEELYLNSNNLSSLYSAYLNNWDRLTRMDFSNNPYYCDCRSQWIVDVLVPILKNSGFNGSPSNMVCMNPRELKGVSFVQLHNASKTLSCPAIESIQEASGPNMAILLGVMIGIFSTFPLVLVIVLLWRNGYFTRCRMKRIDSSSEDEETDAF